MIGNHVAEVYNEFTELAGLGQGEAAADEPKGILNRFIDIVSGIFTPVINVLMAAGMIKGFLALLTTFNVLDKASGTYLILNATGDGLFYFFPLFLGYTASKNLVENRLSAWRLEQHWFIQPSLRPMVVVRPYLQFCRNTD